MRYELEDDELLVIHQDQIDHDLREEQRLLAALEHAHDGDPNVPDGASKQGVEMRLKIVRDSIAATKQKATSAQRRLAQAKKS